MMCQIFIVNRDSYIENQDVYDAHLDKGDSLNNHGSSALFIADNGEHCLVRGLDFTTISTLMTINDNWSKVIIHQRYTTGGAANLSNTHLWQVGDFFYCHNGVLKDERTLNYPVDSQLIGSFLQSGDVWDALAYCQSEPYANVFIANIEQREIWVTRSKDNTLYTDGNGQYSTRKLEGHIDIPVAEHTLHCIKLDKVEDYDKWGYDYSYSSYDDLVRYSTMGNEAESDYQDALELEQKLGEAIVNDDQQAVSKYTYLLEKANGNA